MRGRKLFCATHHYKIFNVYIIIICKRKGEIIKFKIIAKNIIKQNNKKKKS